MAFPAALPAKAEILQSLEGAYENREPKAARLAPGFKRPYSG